MAFNRNQYSRKRSKSLRAAMAEALQTKLLLARFDRGDGTTFPMAEVYPAWPDPEDHYVYPSAVVLPGSAVYEDSGMTPTLLECTWEPEGQAGFGLYKTSELVATYEIQVRAPTDSERDLLVAGLEDMWIADGVLMDHVDGPRYGILLDLPAYWGITSTFSLQTVRILDNEESAQRQHREAVLSVTGRASQVKLGPVQPMKLTITQSLTG